MCLQVLFSEMVSPARCGLAGISAWPLQWVVMHNRANAEVLGYYGGFVSTLPRLSSGRCPLLCQDISTGRQQWLNYQSWMTAAAQMGTKPNNFQESILFWAIGFQSSWRIMWETLTLTLICHFLSYQHGFLPFKTFKALHFMAYLIYIICGGKVQNFWTCFAWLVDLAHALFPLEYNTSFIYLLCFHIWCCRPLLLCWIHGIHTRADWIAHLSAFTTYLSTTSTKEKPSNAAG